LLLARQIPRDTTIEIIVACIAGVVLAIVLIKNQTIGNYIRQLRQKYDQQVTLISRAAQLYSAAQ